MAKDMLEREVEAAEQQKADAQLRIDASTPASKKWSSYLSPVFALFNMHKQHSAENKIETAAKMRQSREQGGPSGPAVG